MNVIMTIKDPYYSRIIEGSKTIEIKKRIPRGLSVGDKMIIVKSGDSGNCRYVATIASIIKLRPEELWRRHHHFLGIEYKDFDDYCGGRPYVYGIAILRPKSLPDGITVADYGYTTEPQNYYATELPVVPTRLRYGK